jgi:thiol-disulfide isomerase/thioredoxin
MMKKMVDYCISRKTKAMKKLYTILAGLALSLTINAQTTLTNAVDFTVTDLNGNSHNLFQILNSGKHVCIDFFFTTCGPCQATAPYFEQTFTNYGCNTADIFFMSIDYGNTNAQCVSYVNTYMGGPSALPVISGVEGTGDAVVSAYGITAFPTYILIAPNQSIIETDMWPISSAATFDTYFSAHSLPQQSCASSITETVDMNNTRLYPNPTTDAITVTSDFNIISYSIYDNSGRMVATQKLDQPALQHRIDVAEFAAGSYTIETQTESGGSRVKFNKQ